MLISGHKGQYGVIYLDERDLFLVLSSSQSNFAKVLVLFVGAMLKPFERPPHNFAFSSVQHLHQHPFKFCWTNVGQMLKPFKRAFPRPISWRSRKPQTRRPLCINTRLRQNIIHYYSEYLKGTRVIIWVEFSFLCSTRTIESISEHSFSLAFGSLFVPHTGAPSHKPQIKIELTE